MYLIHRLLGVVPLLIICGLIAILERQFSLGVGASIYASVVLLTTSIGAMILRSLTVGQSNWRNGLAARLLPFSWILGYGSLLKLCVSNILGSGLFGLMCFVVARYLRQNGYELERIGGWTIACGLAWIVLIGMVLFLVRQFGKRYYTGASGFRKFANLVVGPVIALSASVALFVAGLPVLAFVIAMVPIGIVFVPMAFLLIIVVTTKLSGKPFRWN